MNDFVVKAAGEALQEIKVVNSVWEGEDVKQMSGSDISIAVATDKGLITPILKVSKLFVQLFTRYFQLIDFCLLICHAS